MRLSPTPAFRPALLAASSLGVLALSLAACSRDEAEDGEGGGGSNDAAFTESKPTAPSGKIDKSNVGQDKDSFQGLARQGNPAFQDQSSLQRTAQSRSPGMALAGDADTAGGTATAGSQDPSKLGACAKTMGDTRDADSDKWPKEIKTILDCDLSKLLAGVGAGAGVGGAKLASGGSHGAFAQTPGFQWRITGGFSAKDADDAKKFPESGFSFTYDDYRMTVTGAGEGGKAASMDVAMNGGMTVTGDETGLKGEFKLKTSITAEGKTIKILQWIDSESKPDAAGDIEASGTTKFSGWLTRVDENGKETNIKVATKDLAYDKACGKETGGYRSGTITYAAAEGKAEYVFAECKGTLKVNGEEIK